MIKHILLGLFACGVLLSSYAGQASTVDKFEAMAKYMDLDAIANLVFLDVNGKEIDRAGFAKAFNEGDMSVSVSKRIDNEKRVTKATVSMSLASKNLDLPQVAYKLKPGEVFPAHAGLANLQGRHSLISFYFAGCVPCIKEIPELNALAAKHAGVNFRAMTFDSDEDTKAFVAKHKLEWPVVTNAKTFLDGLGVRSYPAFALIDPDGKLVAIGNHRQLLGKAKNLDELIASLPAPSKAAQ